MLRAIAAVELRVAAMLIRHSAFMPPLHANAAVTSHDIAIERYVAPIHATLC